MVFRRIICNTIPFQALIYCTGRRLFLPFYHTISDTNLPHIQHLYKVKSPKEFEKELDFILKYYKPITTTELTDLTVNQEKIRKRVFLLSFDDGLREMYDIVFPILRRKGVPALFFLNSAFIDNKDLFFRYKASVLYDALIHTNSSVLNRMEKKTGRSFASNPEIRNWLLAIPYTNRNYLDELAQNIDLDFQQYLIDQKPYLTSSQVLEMAQCGFDFGAHSIDHPYFSELSLTEQLHQANESLKYVYQKLGRKHPSFSFPFFDNEVSKSFYEKLHSDTNPCSPHLIFGSSGMKNDEFPYVLHRLCMEKSGTSGPNFIYTEYIKYIIKAILHKNCREHPL
jgi:peptidoglycan/xylan/chitin deacetylase (PgdA/CDA1 family)